MKPYFSNNKYTVTMEARKQIVNSIFLVDFFFDRILKMIGVQNQLPFRLGTDLTCNTIILNNNKYSFCKHYFIYY